jgi:hypothetical protein
MFSLLDLKTKFKTPFETRLGLNYFRFKFAFKNTIPCGFDLALAQHYIAHDSCACEYIKFVHQ